MYAWSCGEIGTNTFVTVPLDPPFNVDPDTGLEQTEVTLWDGVRPEFGPVNGCSVPVEGRNPTQPLWVVIDFTASEAPATTFDLGDPSDPDWLTQRLKNPEKNFLRSTFPDGDMDDVVTRGDALVVFKATHATTSQLGEVAW
jgi:hypothetical protein